MEMETMNEIEVSQALLQKARIVRREEWGASVPSGKDGPLDGIISHLVFTYTDEEPCNCRQDCVRTVQRMQKYHMDNGRFDLPYSFVLGGDGSTYVGRGWRKRPIGPPGLECNSSRMLVFARIGPMKGGFVKDFEAAHYIVRFCQRESLMTRKVEVKRYHQDWNTYEKSDSSEYSN